MDKEELKNKCTERAKIFQQAMECCHSSSPIDCIEWFADRIAELEKENAELKEKLGNYQKGMFDEIEERDINLTKAKEIIKNLLFLHNDKFGSTRLEWRCNVVAEAEQFLKEVEK